MALTESTMLELGTTAPDFALADVVTGRLVRRDDFLGNKALLVMFICTHCPYVRHIERDLAKLGKDSRSPELPLGILTIQISSERPDRSALDVGILHQFQVDLPTKAVCLNHACSGIRDIDVQITAHHVLTGTREVQILIQQDIVGHLLPGLQLADRADAAKFVVRVKNRHIVTRQESVAV